MYNNCRNLLHTYNQNWPSSENLEIFSQAIQEREVTLNKCWVFLDCKAGKFVDKTKTSEFCIMDTRISCHEIPVNRCPR